MIIWKHWLLTLISPLILIANAQDLGQNSPDLGLLMSYNTLLPSQKMEVLKSKLDAKEQDIWKVYLLERTQELKLPFSMFQTMKRVGMCESSWRQYDGGSVLSGVYSPADKGLYQVNTLVHKDTKGFDINTPEGNIEFALYLLQRDGLTPWLYSKHCWE